MHFNGNVCPECSAVFAEEDDIVVCPECGTPHHRECWKSNGFKCCNSSRHGEGFVWQSEKEPEESAKPEDGGKNPDTDSEEEFICPYCGESNPPDALSCFSCGAPMLHRPDGRPFGRVGEFDEQIFMRGISSPPDTEFDGVKVRDAAMYIQQSAPRYIPKFIRLCGGGKISWNWAAFFFSPYWFFYRKLYKVGALFLTLALALSLFLSPYLIAAYDKYEDIATELSGITDRKDVTDEQMKRFDEAMTGTAKAMAMVVAGNCLIGVAAGLVANGVYKKRVIADIKKLRSVSESDNVFAALALRKGGVSYLATAASIVGLRLIVQLISTIASQ